MLKKILHMELKGRIILNFVVLTGVIAIFGYFFESTLSEITVNTKFFHDNELPKLELINDIILTNGRVQSVLLRHVLSTNQVEMRGLEKRIALERSLNDHLFSRLYALLITDEEVSCFQSTNLVRKQYLINLDSIISSSEHTFEPDSINNLVGQLQTAYTLYSNSLDNLNDIILARVKKNNTAIENTAKYAFYKSTALIFVSVIIIFWMCLSLIKITKEISKQNLALKNEIAIRKQIEADLVHEKEYAEKLNHLKSIFLANMSHELRTPLISILGYSEILGEAQHEVEISRIAKTINTSGRRLLETLNLILDLSRIEAGVLKLEPSQIDLSAHIQKVCDQYQEFAGNKSIALSYTCTEPIVLAKLDETLFRQIISNLVNNAIKFTHAGEVVVSLQCIREDNNEVALINVKDTGIGIAPEQVSIIWEDFRQISEGYSREFEGSGLGLSITKKFVEKLGGEISVTSELHVGSTFSLKLPLRWEC